MGANPTCFPRVLGVSSSYSGGMQVGLCGGTPLPNHSPSASDPGSFQLLFSAGSGDLDIRSHQAKLS